MGTSLLVVPTTPPRRVFLAGAVQAPGAVPLEQGATALAAINVVGGPTAFADLPASFILRGSERIAIDMGRVITREAEDMPLVEDDVLVVPVLRPDPVYVVGGLRAPVTLAGRNPVLGGPPRVRRALARTNSLTAEPPSSGSGSDTSNGGPGIS